MLSPHVGLVSQAAQERTPYGAPAQNLFTPGAPGSPSTDAERLMVLGNMRRRDLPLLPPRQAVVIP